MHCHKARALIQDWFDQLGATPMPDAIRDHVHLCEDCRLFIKQWNAIELGLQALKEQTPTVSRDLRMGIRSRIQFERKLAGQTRWKRWQFALAGLSAAVLLFVLLYHILSMARVTQVHSHSGGPSIASTPPSPTPRKPEPQNVPAQISPQLPLINTP